MRLMLVFGFVLSLASATFAEPATQPAPLAVPVVLVMPFAPIGDATRLGWVGQAVQQNMMTELARVRSLKVVAGKMEAGAANDADAVKKIAREAGAVFVIFGNFQLVEPDLRITGEMIDVGTGQSIAGLKATGALRDLFDMEDTLAGQVRRTLVAAQQAANPPAAGAAPLPGPIAKGPPAGIEPSGPLRAPYPWEVESNMDPTYRRVAREYRYDAPDYTWFGGYFGGYGNYGYGGRYSRSYGYSPSYSTPQIVIVNVNNTTPAARR